jgi:hypothetical protein
MVNTLFFLVYLTQGSTQIRIEIKTTVISAVLISIQSLEREQLAL